MFSPGYGQLIVLVSPETLFARVAATGTASSRFTGGRGVSREQNVEIW